MIYGRRCICSFSTPLLCALCVCVELTLEYYAFTICCGVYHKIESQWSTECDDVVVVVVQNSKYYNQSSFRSDKFASCSWRERFDSRKLFILIYLAFRSEMLLLPTAAASDKATYCTCLPSLSLVVFISFSRAPSPFVFFVQEKFLNEVRDFDWQAPPMRFIIKTSPVIVIIVPREWTEFYITQPKTTQSLEWRRLLSILTNISHLQELYDLSLAFVLKRTKKRNNI